MVVEIAAVTLLSFQGSALERTALEAPPRVRYTLPTQEAGASGALRAQAELLMLRNLAFHRTRTQ